MSTPILNEIIAEFADGAESWIVSREVFKDYLDNEKEKRPEVLLTATDLGSAVRVTDIHIDLNWYRNRPKKKSKKAIAKEVRAEFDGALELLVEERDSLAGLRDELAELIKKQLSPLFPEHKEDTNRYAYPLLRNILANLGDAANVVPGSGGYLEVLVEGYEHRALVVEVSALNMPLTNPTVSNKNWYAIVGGPNHQIRVSFSVSGIVKVLTKKASGIDDSGNDPLHPMHG